MRLKHEWTPLKLKHLAYRGLSWQSIIIMDFTHTHTHTHTNWYNHLSCLFFLKFRNRVLSQVHFCLLGVKVFSYPTVFGCWQGSSITGTITPQICLDFSELKSILTITKWYICSLIICLPIAHSPNQRQAYASRDIVVFLLYTDVYHKCMIE